MMASLHFMLDEVLAVLLAVVAVVLSAIAGADHWMRAQMAGVGIARPVQTAVLIAVTLILALLALRVFGGVIRLIVVVVLLLLVIDLFAPFAPAIGGTWGG